MEHDVGAKTELYTIRPTVRQLADPDKLGSGELSRSHLCRCSSRTSYASRWKTARPSLCSSFSAGRAA